MTTTAGGFQTTALTPGAPVVHRVAHQVAQRRWRGTNHVWQVAGRVDLPPRASLRLGGHCLELDLTERAEQRMYRGMYERAEFAVVSRLVRAGDTCVDVGANIGLFTLLLCGLAGPTGRVVAIEPSPLVLDRLRRTVARISSVAVVATAMGDARGELPLDVSNSTHAHATLRSTGGASSVTVPVTTLDDLAGSHGLASIDMLKIDVEGWEAHVLRGAAELLADGRVGAALFEVNPQWGETPDAGALRSAGYQLFVVSALNRGARWRPVLQPWSHSDGPPTQVNAVAVRPDRLAAVESLVVV